MTHLRLRYALNERPPLGKALLFSLQWLVICVPFVIIIGNVVAGLHFSEADKQVMYLQRLFFVTGLSVLLQAYYGHRLPVLSGPAAILLVGVVTALSKSYDVIYSSMALGGLLLLGASVTGLFKRLTGLFTPRIVAVILLLIAFTLAPTIMKMIVTISAGIPVIDNLLFSLLLLFVMLLAGRFLRGIWKSTLVVWAIMSGTLLYRILFPMRIINPASVHFKISLDYLSMGISQVTLEIPVVAAFLICFLALLINDLGSIQAMERLIQPDLMEKRITRGVACTGLSNLLAGFLGVIGPVNYSFSAGVVLVAGCASFWVLAPAGLGLLLISLFPGVIAILGSIPQAVTGTILLYIMCSQMTSGLQIIADDPGPYTLESGIIIATPILIGTMIAFLPAAVVANFPAMLRPIIGNGFIVGVLTVFIMEHVIFPASPRSRPQDKLSKGDDIDERGRY
ncbi:xanthine/uracil/vitamin c permease [Lucifera butyrica]|uniref:Xanthine/uracil/vitamin c permease n=1 Tax=Lucifera butyrica TaxID=1351585 RepID=A0A498R9R8_9FIRM|nr:solute carrier family 23 protein [Lucifera butyrica]VBB06883.1 xanthine/uracil/vitamin c permease [Lucifera butyrica]